jgi:predicted short-subunit dehydrogenase-like oxidoreductase (DUF2520 family)
VNFGLAGSGRVNGSFVSRLPGLGRLLGPVAAQSYRLASRIVNSIGAGRAVRSYGELNASTLILICAPVQAVEQIVSELADALDCPSKIVLLCEGGVGSGPLARLRDRGASVGSLQSVPGFDGDRFVAEGDRTAILAAKRLVRRLGGRLDQIDTGKIALYAAALSFGSSLYSPLLEASLQCLEEAGMAKNSAMKVVEALFQNSLRGYLYAGKRSWNGPLAAGDRAAVEQEMEALGVSKPVLKRLYSETAALAVELLGASGQLGDK